MRRIRYFYIYFSNLINAKFIFKKPNRADILLFDFTNENYLKKIVNMKIEVLYIRLEQINFFIIFKTIINCGFFNFNINYIITYISYVRPKIILTFNDLHPTFYLIKNKIENNKIITIAAQSGYRDKLSFLHFDKRKKYSTNIILVFNKEQAEVYPKNISSKFISTGSLHNNFYEKKNKKNKKKQILFISQFKPQILKGKRYIHYTNIEKKILNYLNEFCNKGKINYVVATKFISKDVYNKYFNTNSRCKFLDTHDRKKKYEILDNFELTVFMDSTLGLESLSRGNKVMAVLLKKFG